MAGVPEDELKQGLRAAFGSAADDQSVLARLEHDGKSVRRVLLRDLEDEIAPLLKPRGGREGRYQVVGEIARGGVGVVLKGRDIDLGRDVAMKVLRDEHQDNPEIVQRFVEEAQIGGQLQHPGIVPVYEMGLNEQKRPYFTMKLVKGKTLAALLRARRDPKENLRRYLAIFERVCDTMAYAHSRGVVHRDLKPANIIIGAYSEVQVVDWGFAKVLGREEPAHIEQTIIETVRSGSESMAGSVMGTPAYMPPEQALGQVESLDTSSDVFGLGAILCEILTGKPPYTGASGQELMMKAARRDFDEERLEGHDLGPLTLRCLSAKQSDRPQDAGELAKEIQDHLAAAEERTCADEVAAAEEQAHAEEARHARKLTLGIAAAVLIACGLGAGFRIHADKRARARAEDVNAQVLPHIEKANLLRGQGNWDGSIAEAKLARELGGEINDAGAVLLQKIEQELRDHELVQRLDDAETVAFRARDMISAAEKALVLYEPGGIEKVASKLRSRPQEIRVRVAHALDALARRKRYNQSDPRDRWVPLVDAAQSLDDDPWRVKMREAFKSEDPARIYSVARAVSAEDPRTLVHAAILVKETGHEKDAIRLLSKAWRHSPDDFTVNWELQWIRGTMGGEADLEEGLRHLRACFALRPDVARLHAELAYLLHKLGREQDALAAAKRYCGLEPNTHFGPTSVANIQLALGNRAAARQALGHAKRLALAPENKENPNHLAWTMVCEPASPLYDPKNGLKLAWRAVEISPDYMTHNTLGVALYRDGNYAGAIEQAKLSLAAKVEGYGSNYNQYLLALAYWRMGEREKARTAYRLAKLRDGTGFPDELRVFDDEAKALGIDK